MQEIVCTPAHNGRCFEKPSTAALTTSQYDMRAHGVVEGDELAFGPWKGGFGGVAAHLRGNAFDLARLGIAGQAAATEHHDLLGAQPACRIDWPPRSTAERNDCGRPQQADQRILKLRQHAAPGRPACSRAQRVGTAL